jgi:hypothetical protein
MDLILKAIILIISSLSLQFSISYEVEKIYVEAIRKTWINHPIQSISLTQHDGYKKIHILGQEDINIFCDCTFIDKYKKPSTSECSPMQKKDGCIELIKLNIDL